MGDWIQNQDLILIIRTCFSLARLTTNHTHKQNSWLWLCAVHSLIHAIVGKISLSPHESHSILVLRLVQVHLSVHITYHLPSGLYTVANDFLGQVVCEEKWTKDHKSWKATYSCALQRSWPGFFSSIDTPDIYELEAAGKSSGSTKTLYELSFMWLGLRLAKQGGNSSTKKGANLNRCVSVEVDLTQRKTEWLSKQQNQWVITHSNCGVLRTKPAVL